MTKQTYREVKREANVGERIKIVNPQIAVDYGMGDVFTVTNVWSHASGFIDNAGERNSAYHEEYVVLEPVPTSGTDEALASAFTQFIRDNADTIRTILGDSASNVTKPEPTELTRAAVIEKARADVAELGRVGRDIDSHLPEPSPFYSKFYGVKFYVNREKRVVTAVITYRDGSAVRARGIAKAAPDDVFNADIGKAIALRRALGLTVPREYTDAPKPDEPRVGAVTRKTTGLSAGSIRTLSKRVPGCDGIGFGNFAFRTEEGSGWIADKQYVITDDTDVDYSVGDTEGAAA
ncbi:hypothetical protein RBB83_17345 [Paenibacillus peoriae]|uniref:hypothetical protein n=1 Tax=Paenibacillus peoriae TaxID=59893 RepID=UPI0030CC7230